MSLVGNACGLCSCRMVLHDYSPHHRTLVRGFLRDEGQRRESLTFSIFSGCKCFAVATVLKSSQCGLMFQLHSLTQLYQSRSSLTKLIFRSLYISQHPFSTGKDLDGRKGVCLTLQISNIMRYKTCKSAALK